MSHLRSPGLLTPCESPLAALVGQNPGLWGGGTVLEPHSLPAFLLETLGREMASMGCCLNPEFLCVLPARWHRVLMKRRNDRATRFVANECPLFAVGYLRVVSHASGDHLYHRGHWALGSAGSKARGRTQNSRLALSPEVPMLQNTDSVTHVCVTGKPRHKAGSRETMLLSQIAGLLRVELQSACDFLSTAVSCLLFNRET